MVIVQEEGVYFHSISRYVDIKTWKEVEFTPVRLFDKRWQKMTSLVARRLACDQAAKSRNVFMAQNYCSANSDQASKNEHAQKPWVGIIIF